jgi:DNA polymerase III subunit delta
MLLMITLIHGPAELLRAEALAQIRASIAEDASLAELNTIVLDGRQLTLADLQFACEVLPFLAQRRLVIVEGLLRMLPAPSRARSKTAAAIEAATAQYESLPEVPENQQTPPRQDARQALLAYLDRVPEMTELVLMEEELLAAGPVLRRLVALQRDGRAALVVCNRPKKGDLPAWIRSRAKMRGVQLDPGAVADLAEFVGDDLRQLDQELIKLRDYAGGSPASGRPPAITRADVRRLVPATRAANVFDLVEALGMGNMSMAGRLLHHALETDGEPPLRLLALIGRQYRLMIQAKVLQKRGAKPPQIAAELGLPDWTVPKLQAQAARHTFADLERAMERVLAADEAIKTGRLNDREAMDILLAELAGTTAR